MIKLFNTEFEASMRILLLLSSYEFALDTEEIRIIDVLTVYGKQFNISDTSLNGDCIYTLAEFTSGIELCEDSLKTLSLQGLIQVKMTKKDGFKYESNAEGKKYASQMNSDYSKEYIKELNKVKKYISSKSVIDIKKEIRDKLIRRIY